MLIAFGKYRGTSTEMVVIKHADYAVWLLRQAAVNNSFARVQSDVERLIREFDAKPFTACCQRTGCGETATRGYVYRGSVQLSWWCDDCDPSDETGVPTGKRVVLRSYGDFVRYAGGHCNGRRADLGVLVKGLARAKGLPDRVGEPVAASFFPLSS